MFFRVRGHLFKSFRMMWSGSLLTLVIGAFLVGSDAAVGRLPADVPKCDVKDPAVNECLKTAIIGGLQKLKNGKKSLGLLSIDPLSVDQVTLDLGTDAAPFLFKAKDVKVHGLTNSIIKSVDFKPTKYYLEFHSVTPNATFTFNYEANGRLLVLPVNGNGPGSFVFTDLAVNQHIEGTPMKKDGRVYWNVTNYDFKFDAKKLDIELEGLLKGNKQVSEQLSEFLRIEWRIFLDQLRGPAAEAFGQIFKDLATRIFSRVPYGDAFPGADDLINKS